MKRKSMNLANAVTPEEVAAMLRTKAADIGDFIAGFVDRQGADDKEDRMLIRELEACASRIERMSRQAKKIA